MNKLRSATTAVLLCFLLALTLSACGGSSSSSAGATPSAVTNLAVAAASQQATISWDTPATNPPTYNIYWSNDPTKANKKSGSKIANVTSPYAHTGLVNNQPYYYVVTQIVGGVESPESLTISATPQAAIPAAPDGLSISATNSAITLAFDSTASQPSKAGQTCTYNIYYSTSSSVSKTSYTNKIATAKFDPVTNTSITIPNLANGTPYYFVVTVVVNDVESNESDTLTATPMAVTAAQNTTGTPPASFSSPDNLSVDPGNQQAIITWSASTAPSTIPTGYSSTPVYTIYAATNQGFTTNNIKVQNVTSPYTMTGLTNNTPYFFKVTSGIQTSPATTPASISNEVPSTIISATPYTKVPDVPSGIAASQGSQQVSLSWSQDTSGIQSSVAPSVSYNIYYYPVSSSSSTTPPTSSAVLEAAAKANNYVITGITTNSYVHSGLTPNTTYYYVITAVGEGESAPSSIVSVSL
jgi:hypothetical protein